jgi:uncharacterized membrane protein YphA (DoxX/SURF4 family)
VVQTLLTLIRLGLIGTFVLAGTAKVISPSATRRSARELGLPAFPARLLPIALPITELAVAVGLLYQRASRPAAVAALLLLLVFSTIVAINLARNNRVRCACFGSLSSPRLGRGALIRNAILAGAALTIALSHSRLELADGHSKNAAWSWLVLAVVGLAPVLVLLAAISAKRRAATKTSPPSNGRATPVPTLDIRELELVTSDGAAIPQETLDHLRLLIFVSSGCDHCDAVARHVGSATSARAEPVTAMLVLSGTPGERPLKPEWPESAVLYDHAFKTARGLDIRAIPTAVPVGMDGRSRKERYVGAKAIVGAIDALDHEASGVSYQA